MLLIQLLKKQNFYLRLVSNAFISNSTVLSYDAVNSPGVSDLLINMKIIIIIIIIIIIKIKILKQIINPPLPAPIFPSPYEFGDINYLILDTDYKNYAFLDHCQTYDHGFGTNEYLLFMVRNLTQVELTFLSVINNVFQIYNNLTAYAGTDLKLVNRLPICNNF